MPQFILDIGNAYRSWESLDAFTQGYIEAMFFTDTGTGDDEEGGLETASFDELSPDTLKGIISDCKAFQAEAEALLNEAYRRGYEEVQAGRDFWFTRNGHGVGFWDRDVLDKDDLGRRLSDLCGFRTRYTECYVYRGDDGHIYAG